MATDLTYKPASGSRTLTLTGSSDVPDILHKAITLMLFGEDPDIRNFDGTSIVNAFPTLQQAGFEGISHYLTIAASRILTILQDEYPGVSNVYFEETDSPGALGIILNVVVGDATETAVVY